MSKSQSVDVERMVAEVLAEDPILRPIQTKRDGRRQFSPEDKAELVRRATRPGVSIAAVALAHNLNTNLLHKWIREAQAAQSHAGRAAGSLVPVTVREIAPAGENTMARAARASAVPGGESRIEVELAGAKLTLFGPIPMGLAREWVALLREGR